MLIALIICGFLTISVIAVLLFLTFIYIKEYDRDKRILEDLKKTQDIQNQFLDKLPVYFATMPLEEAEKIISPKKKKKVATKTEEPKQKEELNEPWFNKNGGKKDVN